MKVLVTGSCGLIGSEAVRYYGERAEQIVGIDNNMRAQFFGPEGDTAWMKRSLEGQFHNYKHLDIDIRARKKINETVCDLRPDLIIHCAAQPSHDYAARAPFLDFEVNALGTLNLLEATRRWNPEAVFIFMSTNKVYGDAPNNIRLKELETRWDYDDPKYENGVPESFSIDQTKHSLFGASKVAADIMVQEYGRYFEMKTVAFRGGCLTGAGHSGVELHGFLSYLFKTVHTGKLYTIFGYKGKQVRDQIHSTDVIKAFDEFYKKPKCGEVYNLGGGKQNSVSVMESIKKIEQLLDTKANYTYSEQNRIGDHICYYSDLSKFKRDYPNWTISYSIDSIFEEYTRKIIIAK